MILTEAFRDHLHRCVGANMIPLAYVIRDDEAVPGPCLPLKKRISRLVKSTDLSKKTLSIVRHMDTDCTRQTMPACTSSWRRPLVELLKPTLYHPYKGRRMLEERSWPFLDNILARKNGRA